MNTTTTTKPASRFLGSRPDRRSLGRMIADKLQWGMALLGMIACVMITRDLFQQLMWTQTF